MLRANGDSGSEKEQAWETILSKEEIIRVHYPPPPLKLHVFVILFPRKARLVSVDRYGTGQAEVEAFIFVTQR